MLDTQIRQLIVDEEHLRLLRIGYFISAISTGFFALFGLLYAGIGLVIGAMPEAAQQQPGAESPETIGLIFAIGGLLFAGAFGSVAALKLYVALSEAAQGPGTLPGGGGDFVSRAPIRNRARDLHLLRVIATFGAQAVRARRGRFTRRGRSAVGRFARPHEMHMKGRRGARVEVVRDGIAVPVTVSVRVYMSLKLQCFMPRHRPAADSIGRVE